MGNCRGNISSANEILPRVFKLKKKLHGEMDETHRFIKRCYQGKDKIEQSRSKDVNRQSRAGFEINKVRVILCHVI